MTDTIKTSRRALLAGVPAAALVVATPAMATALGGLPGTLAEPDPIFAAIEAHLTAILELNAADDIAGPMRGDDPGWKAPALLPRKHATPRWTLCETC
jgi:hypothetical protein